MYLVTITNGNKSNEIHGYREKLFSGKVVKGINSIDSFSFSMLPSNIGFNRLQDFKTLVKVYNTNKNRYEFYGRVLYSSATMDENGSIQKEATCESYFGYLCDSQQEYVDLRAWTKESLLKHIVNVHNAQVEEEKRFVVGKVDKPLTPVMSGIQRQNTWESIKKHVIEQNGGEIRYRVVGDVIYIDWLEAIGETKTTEIALSRNMKTITREIDPTKLISRLIPLGAKLSDDSEERLDISSVNNGKNYIDDENAIAKYGIHVGYYENDEETNALNLRAKARQWLTKNNKVQVKYSITALDLSLLGLDIDDFDVCNSYPIKNALLGIDDVARIIKKTIDVCEEVKSTIEIGDNFKTLTELQREQSRKLADAANTVAVISANYVTNQKLANELAAERTYTTSLINQLSDEITLSVSEEELAAGIAEAKAYTDGQIQIKAGEINLSVSAIETKAINAQSAADRANTNAIEAYNTAFSAGSKAEQAQTTAQNAETTASTANATANRAKTAADYAASSAGEALSRTSEVELTANGAKAVAENAQATANEVKAELSLKIGRDENDQIVSMLNASANIINITSNRLVIDSDYFKLSADGKIIATNAEISGNISATSFDSYSEERGSRAYTAHGHVYFSQEYSNYTSCARLSGGDGFYSYYQDSNKNTTASGSIVAFRDAFMISANIGTGALIGTWQSTGAIAVVSDRNKKHDIEVLDESYSTLFDSLSPVRFKYNDGTSDRYHVGFIAQEVEEAITAAGLTTQDAAFLVHNKTDDTYSLRYSEFIALCVGEIQRLKKRVTVLESA